MVIVVMVIEGWFNYRMQNSINFYFTFNTIVDWHEFQYFTFRGSLFK